MKLSNVNKPILFILFSVCLFTASMMQSCKKSDNTTTTTATLYDTLGGTTMVTDPNNTSAQIEKGRLAIRSVIDSTIFVIAADTAINGQFTVLLAEVHSGNLSGFAALSKNLTDFVAVNIGAKNYSYTGKSMTDAHNPTGNPTRVHQKVDSGDFDSFIADVVKGAQKNSVPTDIINKLGAVLTTVKTQVVQQ